MNQQVTFAVPRQGLGAVLEKTTRDVTRCALEKELGCRGLPEVIAVAAKKLATYHDPRHFYSCIQGTSTCYLFLLGASNTSLISELATIS